MSSKGSKPAKDKVAPKATASSVENKAKPAALDEDKDVRDKDKDSKDLSSTDRLILQMMGKFDSFKSDITSRVDSFSSRVDRVEKGLSPTPPSKAAEKAASKSNDDSAPPVLPESDEKSHSQRKREKRSRRRERKERKAPKKVDLNLVKSMSASADKKVEDVKAEDKSAAAVVPENSGDVSDDKFADNVARASGADGSDDSTSLSDGSDSDNDREDKPKTPKDRSPTPRTKPSRPMPPKPKFCTPYPASRPIPKWIWDLQNYATPHNAHGQAWFTPGLTEQVYRKHGSFAAAVPSMIKLTTNDYDTDRNFQECLVLATAADAIVGTDYAVAMEVITRRIQALKEYSSRNDSAWLKALSYTEADDIPVSQEVYRRVAKESDRISKERDRKSSNRGRSFQNAANSADPKSNAPSAKSKGRKRQ